MRKLLKSHESAPYKVKGRGWAKVSAISGNIALVRFITGKDKNKMEIIKLNQLYRKTL